jgi:ABC-2 type transport system permease protein
MIRVPHLKLIAGHSVRHGIRGGAGLMAMLMTLVIGLGLAAIVLDPLDQAKNLGGRLSAADAARLKAETAEMVVGIARKAIDWAVEPSREQLSYLTREQPAIISAILVLLFLVTPLLSCMAGFNQTSGDIGTKGLRFLLIRTERPNIFLGRFLGTYLFSAVVYLTMFAILALYVAVKVDVHPTGDMIRWLLFGYLRLMLFSLPYIAICAWVSCMIDSAFGSLMIALVLVYLVPMVLGIASGIEEKISYGQYITPWGWKYLLLEPMGPRFLGGVAAMLGFTAFFLFVGMRHFNKRDL